MHWITWYIELCDEYYIKLYLTLFTELKKYLLIITFLSRCKIPIELIETSSCVIDVM